MSKLLCMDFKEIHSGLFMAKDPVKMLLFTIENGFSKLSNSIYYSFLEVKLYMFNTKCFFSNDWELPMFSYNSQGL